MSLILDALNRADQERSEENNQINLHASQSPVVQSGHPVRRWIIEGIIVLLAIGAFFYSQWQPSKEVSEPVNVAEEALALTPKTPLPKPAVAPSKKTDQPQQPKPLGNTTSSAKKETAAKQSGDAAITSLYQQQNAIQEKIPAQEKAPAKTTKQKPESRPKPEIKPQAPVDNTQSILQQIPLITQLSDQFQRTVPSINYEVHMYAEGSRGFVTINGSVLKTGTVTDSGLRVIAILEDSVVLEFNNHQFRLPALNSWVNYN